MNTDNFIYGNTVLMINVRNKFIRDDNFMFPFGKIRLGASINSDQSQIYMCVLLFL